MVRVGFLQCDGIPEPHDRVAGDYGELFARLLDGHGIELVTHRADHDALPRSPADCDGWLIGGSRRSVYDDVGWIHRLAAFTEVLAGSGRPLVGVCFGHQMVARALGAEVARVGWTIGAVDYRFDGPRSVDAHSFTIVASHQDQVLDLPAGTELFASTDACPVAGFATGSVLTLQGHPEFTPALGASLARSRRELLGDEMVDAALASLDRPLDSAAVGSWLASFLHGDAGRGRSVGG